MNNSTTIAGTLKGACFTMAVILLFATFGAFWSIAMLLYGAAGFCVWLLFLVLGKSDPVLMKEAADVQDNLFLCIIMWPMLAVLAGFAYYDGRIAKLLSEEKS